MDIFRRMVGLALQALWRIFVWILPLLFRLASLASATAAIGIAALWSGFVPSIERIADHIVGRLIDFGLPPEIADQFHYPAVVAGVWLIMTGWVVVLAVAVMAVMMIL